MSHLCTLNACLGDLEVPVNETTLSYLAVTERMLQGLKDKNAQPFATIYLQLSLGRQIFHDLPDIAAC